MKNTLIGKWQSNPDDTAALNEYGKVELEFTKDGRLIYTLHEQNKKSIILLTYKVDENILETDQPSAPNIERVRFSINDDILTLHQEACPASYIRKRGFLANIFR